MNELDELRQEVLENTDLDINEKMCLIVLLCGIGAGGEREIARLMGATVQTARLALDSLKKKGYLSLPMSRTDGAPSSERKTRSASSEERGDARMTGAPRRAQGSGEWEDDDDSYYVEYGGNTFAERYVEDHSQDAYVDPRREAESQRLANYLMSDEKRVEGSGLIKKGSTRASIAQQRYANSTSQRSNKEREALEQLEKARESFANRKYSNRQAENRQLDDRKMPDDAMESMNDKRQSADEFSAERDFSTFQRNALNETFVGNSSTSKTRTSRSASPEPDPKRRPTGKVSGNLKSSAMREITEEKVQKVMQLMDEALTRPEATIILGFAGGDYEKVERVYERVRRTQIKDKVDALVKLLQSED